LVLPHFRTCLLHHIALVEACQCGMPLELFSLYSQPFTCDACGLDWGRLPRISADSKRIELEQKYLACYTFFFSQGNPILLKRAWQLVKDQVITKNKEAFPPNRGLTFRGPMPYKTEILCVLVAALVFFDLSPHDVLTYNGSSIRQKLYGIEKFYDFFVPRIYVNSILSEWGSSSFSNGV
jgi:hypothetical protein